MDVIKRNGKANVVDPTPGPPTPADRVTGPQGSRCSTRIWSGDPVRATVDIDGSDAAENSAKRREVRRRVMDRRAARLLKASISAGATARRTTSGPWSRPIRSIGLPLPGRIAVVGTMVVTAVRVVEPDGSEAPPYYVLEAARAGEPA